MNARLISVLARMSGVTALYELVGASAGLWIEFWFACNARNRFDGHSSSLFPYIYFLTFPYILLISLHLMDES